MLRRIGITVTAAALALALAGLAGSAASSTFKLSATLTASKEVPAAKGAGAARGAFAGTMTGLKIKWKLTYSHLTGPGLQAHIHLGKPGKAGNVLVALCSPCHSGQTGVSAVTAKIATEIKAGSTYANVHTAKNPGGEIRGQITSVASAPVPGY